MFHVKRRPEIEGLERVTDVGEGFAFACWVRLMYPNLCRSGRFDVGFWRVAQNQWRYRPCPAATPA